MGYFGRVEVGGALVWGGGVGRGGLGRCFGWVHCLIMPNFFIDSVKMEVSLANTKKMRLPILLIL